MSITGPTETAKIPFTVELFNVWLHQGKVNKAKIKDITSGFRQHFKFIREDLWCQIPSGYYKNYSLFMLFALSLTLKGLQESEAKKAGAVIVNNELEGDEVSFRDIWSKYKNQISAKQLSNIVDVYTNEEGTATALSPAMTLLMGAMHNVGRDIMLEILTQWPEVISPTELYIPVDNGKTLGILLQEEAAKDEWVQKILTLITARNDFFKLLLKIKTKDEAHAKLEELKGLAKTAFDLGYINAFYDVGMLLVELEMPLEALSCFDQVPTSSKYFQQSAQCPVNTAYSLALAPELNAHQRMLHLKHALQFALKIPEPSIRNEYIQKIAYSYITWGNELGLDAQSLNPVPDYLLEAMHEDTSVEWIFKVFDGIKEKLEFKKAAEQLTKENAKLRATIGNFSANHETQAEMMQLIKEMHQTIMVGASVPAAVAPLYELTRNGHKRPHEGAPIDAVPGAAEQSTKAAKL